MSVKKRNLRKMFCIKSKYFMPNTFWNLSISQNNISSKYVKLFCGVILKN